MRDQYFSSHASVGPFRNQGVLLLITQSECGQCFADKRRSKAGQIRSAPDCLVQREWQRSTGTAGLKRVSEPQHNCLCLRAGTRKSSYLTMLSWYIDARRQGTHGLANWSRLWAFAIESHSCSSSLFIFHFTLSVVPTVRCYTVYMRTYQRLKQISDFALNSRCVRFQKRIKMDFGSFESPFSLGHDQDTGSRPQYVDGENAAKARREQNRQAKKNARKSYHVRCFQYNNTSIR